jgi:hypothetical protein
VYTIYKNGTGARSYTISNIEIEDDIYWHITYILVTYTAETKTGQDDVIYMRYWNHNPITEIGRIDGVDGSNLDGLTAKEKLNAEDTKIWAVDEEKRKPEWILLESNWVQLYSWKDTYHVFVLYDHRWPENVLWDVKKFGLYLYMGCPAVPPILCD